MSVVRFGSVKEYLASLESVRAETLRSSIAFILEEFPELKAKIAWNVPQIHRGEKYVFGFAALKNHLSFSPWSARVLESFRGRLSGFVVKANLFQVPPNWLPDKDLLRDLVAARMAEISED